MVPWFMMLRSTSDSRILSRLRRPFGRFNTELPGVLGVQSLPAAELHDLGADDASNRLTREEALKDVEGDVPARGAPRDEAAIDAVPQRQARAATRGFEFPPGIVVLQYLGSVGSRHSCFQRRGRSHPGEPHRSNRTQAPIDLKWRPLAQMRRVGKRLPDFFRRVAQFSDENERSLLSVLSYLRPAGRTRCVLLAIGHRAACDLRASWTSWMRLPQVSFSIAMMEAVTSVGGIVNWAPRALIRS